MHFDELSPRLIRALEMHPLKGGNVFIIMIQLTFICQIHHTFPLPDMQYLDADLTL